MIPDLRVPRVLAAVLRRSAAVVAVAAASLLAGCDKVPLTAPSNATITLYSNTQIVPLNGTATVTATIIQTGGSAVHNGTVVSFTSSLGTIEPAEAETKDGKVTVTFRAGTQSGTAVINAHSGGASTTASTSTGTTTGTATTTTAAGSGLTLLVGSAAAASVVVAASPGTVSGMGGNSVITATVLDTNNNALPGVSVSFATDVGTVSPVSSTTNAIGQATTTLNTYQTATVTVTAGAKITGTVKVTASVMPTVTITSATTTPTVGQTTSFTVAITVGSGGAPITHSTINFGDGSSTFNLGSASGSITVPHVYSRDGTFTVTATATDASGQSVQGSVPVTIYPAVPFTLTVTASSGRVGTPITMTAIPAAGAPGIISYVWNFGDGTASVTTTTGTTSHIYTSIPTGYTSFPYVITVTATGSDGRTGIGSTSTTVSQ